MLQNRLSCSFFYCGCLVCHQTHSIMQVLTHPLAWSSTLPCSLRNSLIHLFSVSEEYLSEQVTPLEVCVSVCDICLMCACGPQGEK